MKISVSATQYSDCLGSLLQRSKSPMLTLDRRFIYDTLSGALI